MPQTPPGRDARCVGNLVHAAMTARFGWPAHEAKNRLALVIVLFLSTFVGCYSLLLLLEVPERANVETDGALPWVISLLPGHVDTSLHGAAAQRQALATLVHGFDGIRHVRVVLRAPDGALLARASSPA